MADWWVHPSQLIGGGDRSERIRTYQYAQDRVTDHQAGFTLQGVARFVNAEGGGEAMDELFDKLEEREIAMRLEALFES